MPVVNVVTRTNAIEHFSRDEALKWVNTVLEAEFSRIEELETGAPFCQLFDSIFPGSIPLKKVKFATNLEHEYIQNYKILQCAFIEKEVNREINVEKLVKGAFQYIYDLVLWFKKFFDANYQGKWYDPVAARGGQYLGTPNPSSQTEVTVKSRTLGSATPITPMPLKSEENVCKPETGASEKIDHAKQKLEELVGQAIQLQHALREAEMEREEIRKQMIEMEKIGLMHWGGPHSQRAIGILSVIYGEIKLPEDAKWPEKKNSTKPKKRTTQGGGTVNGRAL